MLITSGARQRGYNSIAAFGADLQDTRRNPYGFDSLQFDPHARIPKRNESYYARYRRYYDENRWYNSHVNCIAESIMQLGFELETNDEGRQKVWADWCKATGFLEILYDSIIAQFALGNSYCAIVPAERLGITDPAAKGWGLQVLTSEYCYNIPDDADILKAFYHDPLTGGRLVIVGRQEIPAKSRGPWILLADMLYLRGDRLGNDLYGRPLASTAGEAFDDMAILQSTRNALAKRAAYDFIVADVDVSHISSTNSGTKAANLEEEYLNGVIDKFREVEQYDATTGKMTILNRLVFKSRRSQLNPEIKQGLVDVKSLGNTADFAGLTQVIDQLWDELSMTLRVPQVFMGRKEGSNRAQSVTEFLAFAQYLQAKRSQIAREIERKILPLIDLAGETLGAGTSRVPSQDLVYAQISEIIGRIPQLRDDEKRTIIGTALDVELEGDAPPPPPPPQAPGFAQGPPGQDSNDRREQAKMAKHGMTRSEEAFREEWDFNPVKTLAKYRLALDAEVIAMADSFLAQAKQAMEGAAKMAAADPTKIKALTAVKPDTKHFEVLLDDFNKQLYFQARQDILGLAELPADFTFTDTRGLDRLLAVNQMHAEDAISPVGAEARRVLVDTLNQGGSVDDAADAVRKAFDDYDTDRLVRTELNRAGNAGTLDAYRESYAGEKVRWMTSLDDLVDGRCRALEAEYASGVTIEQAEALDIPPEHPNCRCRWVPVSEWSFVTGLGA
ncbi:MAG TPA: phage minor head protein [Candidatus Thermoplasmatota archaeon]|nr:phage minor head protein [Candidatus Thermoplasmatota archaeon]